MASQPHQNGGDAKSGQSDKSGLSSPQIDILRQAFQGTKAKIVLPRDEGYGAAIRCWSKAAEKPAGVAIIPTNAEEVSIAVNFAVKTGLELAVKGGGHSSSGASCTDGGVLIDLSAMRAVRVDPAEQLIYVEGGALWSDVDQEAWRYGLATVGGTVSHTGVGGLTLGGGYGVLSGKHGLTIDNWVGATTVLANGEIVKSGIHDEDPDLFWALRGAGQNFGVITEFVLKLHPQSDLYMGTMIFPAIPEVIDRVVTATNNLYEFKEKTPTGMQTKSNGRTNTVIGFARPPEAGGAILMLVVMQVLVNNQAEAEEIISEYLEIGPIMNTMKMGPYPDVNNLIPAPHGFRCNIKSSVFMPPLRNAFALDALSRYEQFMDSCPDAGKTILAWEWTDPSKIIASDAGCFANRGKHLNTLIMPVWTKPENDKFCRDWARELSEHFRAELEHQNLETSDGIEGGVSLRGSKGAVLMYGNYDQTDERSRDVFGINYERLQKIKGRYDPKNKFNKLFAIKPVGE
ncbi:hypothetical protein KCU65_g8307, partial [Aureobasidium melanogenum]